MSYFKVNHSSGLFGETTIQGSKNAVLPVIAATVLHQGQTVIRNCPDISDVRNMIAILLHIGCKCEFQNHTLAIDASAVTNTPVPEQEVSKIRSSVIMLGALLGRLEEAKIAYPGGCNIGSRKIDIHLELFRQMGFETTANDKFVSIKGKVKENKQVVLGFQSVGATENGIIAAVLSDGKTITIKNAAKEPEISNLCRALNTMGADIKGIGTDTLVITGVLKLHDAIVEIEADRIVAGTYLAALAGVGGNITLKGVNKSFDEAVLQTFLKFGNRYHFYENELAIRCTLPKDNHKKPDITVSTATYPGFPTDMQSQLMAVMSVNGRNGIIIENIFENRLRNAEMLNRMGADILVVDDRTAHVNGVSHLKGAKVRALDLRSGAALIIAGLMAQGTTIVENADCILRGYEHIDRDLQELAAVVEFVSEE